MNLVASILAISIAIVLYIYTIEFFIILFRTTGLTKEKARFQVISLVTCSGFTTSEAEIITTDKRRRRIGIVCMITGTIFNVIIISFIINLIGNISSSEYSHELIINTATILGIAVAFIVFTKLPPIAKLIEKVTLSFARRLFFKNQRENALTMLDSYNQDAIVEIYLNNIPEVLKDKTLQQSNLKAQYNINVLMLSRKNRTIEITKDTIIQNHDLLVVFGNKQSIKDLFTYKLDNNDVEEVIKTKENVITLIDNYGSDAMAEIDINKLPEILHDKKLSESELKTVYNLNVIMVKRDDLPIKVTKDTVIKENDNIVIFGNYDSIKKVFLN